VGEEVGEVRGKYKSEGKGVDEGKRGLDRIGGEGGGWWGESARGRGVEGGIWGGEEVVEKGLGSGELVRG